MNIKMTTMTVGEIRSQLDRKELTVNHDYQRTSSVWISSAKSYFIDTILAGFPFPKIYVYAYYGEDIGAEDSIKKEIVDGQQRVVTMMEYLNNEFYVSTPKSAFRRKRYRDLGADDKQRFINTIVEVDLILQAEQSEVLQMFRRMNSYMAPLNSSEKRHANHDGDFKWFINALSDQYSPILRSFGTLTAKQISRMADAEFLTELTQVLDIGIVDKNEKNLEKIYSKYNETFDNEDVFEGKIDEFFGVLSTTFKSLARTPLMKTYNLYSLFCAMMGRKYGFPGSKELGIRRRGTFFKSAKTAVKTLRELATELQSDPEENEVGPFSAFVDETLAQTTRVATREPRAQLLAEYLDA